MTPARQSAGEGLASLFVGLLAMNIALASGVVFWRHWPPGDAADIGFTAALATYFLLRRVGR